MLIALSVCIAVILIVLTVFGYVSDVRRSLLGLLGTLVGVTLVQFWAAPWGSWLVESVGGKTARNVFIVSCLLLLWGALVVGYGGGLLLGRPAARPAVQQRVVGAALGLVNAVLIAGFVLRYATAQQPGFAAVVDATIVARLLRDWLPALFLAFAAGVTLLVFVRALTTLAVRRAARAPKPGPEPASAVAATPVSADKEKQVGEPGALGKANNVPRQ